MFAVHTGCGRLPSNAADSEVTLHASLTVAPTRKKSWSRNDGNSMKYGLNKLIVMERRAAGMEEKDV